MKQQILKWENCCTMPSGGRLTPVPASLPPQIAWFYIGIVKETQGLPFHLSLFSPHGLPLVKYSIGSNPLNRPAKAKQEDQPSSVILGRPPSWLGSHRCLSASWKRNKNSRRRVALLIGLFFLIYGTHCIFI